MGDEDLSRPMPDTREIAAMWFGRRRADRMSDEDLLRFEKIAAEVFNRRFETEDVGP